MWSFLHSKCKASPSFFFPQKSNKGAGVHNGWTGQHVFSQMLLYFYPLSLTIEI